MVQLPHPNDEREVDHESCSLYLPAWTRRLADGLLDARGDGLSRAYRACLCNARDARLQHNPRLQHVAVVLCHACLGLFHDDGLRWLPSWIRRPSSPAPWPVAQRSSGCTRGTWRARRTRGACKGGRPYQRSEAIRACRRIATERGRSAASSRQPACEGVHYETFAQKGFVRKGFPMEGRQFRKKQWLAREGHRAQEKVIARGQRAAGGNRIHSLGGTVAPSKTYGASPWLTMTRVPSE